MKNIIISGASSGIGAEIARYFAKNKWNLFLIARNEEKLKSLGLDFENITLLPCDLTDKSSIQDLKNQIEGTEFHALINNAGIYQPTSLDDDNDEVWQNHFESNLMSAVRLTRLVWPSLKKNKGCVLNISSTLAIRPIPNTAAYSALKAAMSNWTLSLALEGAPHGVRANSICPGIIDTPIHSYFESTSNADQELYQMLQKAQPLGRTGKVSDIAPMAYQLCSDDSAWITGTSLNIDGGILLNS